MKRYLVLPLVVGALLGAALVSAPEAQAHASQTRVCTGCHGPAAAVVVTAVQTANNGVNATYNVTVNNPYGQTSWAVFSGSTKSAGAAGAGSTAVVLPVGKTYTVFGVSGNGNGTEGYASISISPAAPPATAPAAPVISAAYPVSTNSVTITWPAVAGATSYDYQVGTGAVINTTGTSVTLTGLAAGTTAFKVRSANSGGTSTYSAASIVYTPPAVPAAPTVSPTYPVSATTVTITWPAVVGATSYDYQVGTGLVTNTTATSVTVTGLALGTTAFKVRSVNTAGASAYASASIVRTTATAAPWHSDPERDLSHDHRFGHDRLDAGSRRGKLRLSGGRRTDPEHRRNVDHPDRPRFRNDGVQASRGQRCGRECLPLRLGRLHPAARSRIAGARFELQRACWRRDDHLACGRWSNELRLPGRLRRHREHDLDFGNSERPGRRDDRVQAARRE